MNKKTKKIFAIVGMAGSGKTKTAEYIAKKYKFSFIRFGQIVLDQIKKQGKKPNEELERKIRNSIRKKYGAAAMAILNLPFIKNEIKYNDIVIDGLYSWSEYKYLKEKFKNKLIIIAVYASPKIRYQRLSKRKLKKTDFVMRYRPLTKKEAKARDYHEIEEIEKAGPIAMADHMIINQTTLDKLYSQIKKIIKEETNK